MARPLHADYPNMYEHAREKYRRNAVQQGRLNPTVEREEQGNRRYNDPPLAAKKIEAAMPQPAPAVKAKPSSNCDIMILVSLPGQQFEFTFTKDNVLGNVPRGRLNRAEFLNMFMKGFEPLLGGVRERK